MDVKIQREVSVNENICVHNNKDAFFVTLELRTFLGPYLRWKIDFLLKQMRRKSISFDIKDLLR